jgi:hypothetical protein
MEIKELLTAQGWTEVKDPDGGPNNLHFAKVLPVRDTEFNLRSFVGLSINEPGKNYSIIGGPDLDPNTQATLNVLGYTDRNDFYKKLNLKPPRICKNCSTKDEFEKEDGELVCLICGTPADKD